MQYAATEYIVSRPLVPLLSYRKGRPQSFNQSTYKRTREALHVAYADVLKGRLPTRAMGMGVGSAGMGTALLPEPESDKLGVAMCEGIVGGKKVV